MSGLKECPKFKKNFERKYTAKFCFSPFFDYEPRFWPENHIGTKFPLTMLEANTNEYPYWEIAPFYPKTGVIAKKTTA